MRHKILMRSLFLLGLVTVAATSLTAASLLSPDDAPEVAPIPNAPGFYLVGGRSLDPGDFHHAGELQIWSWADLHSGPNSFNWARLDQFITGHYLPPGPGQPGKKAAIAITPYQGRSDAGAMAMPDWVRATPNTTIPGVLTQEVKNGSFSNGLDSWEAVGQVSGDLGFARLGGDQAGIARLEQYNVRIPFVLNQGSFSFWWRSAVSGGVSDPEDVFKVEVLDGNEWIHFVDVRQSCYRFDVHPLPPACDGDVDIADVLTVAGCFGQPVSASCPALLDFDGLNGVDVADIVAVADQWDWQQ
ncbi:MAG TPA: hypothetical protein VL334_18250 [Anaerolineae bacterium]|nr:hypothetical protein [Anaerolineae bacterium]